MFSEEAKSWILKNIKLENLNNKIKYLEMALEISENLEGLSNLKSSIIDQVNFFPVDINRVELESLSKVSQFLEVFIYLKLPEEYKKIEKTRDSKNIPEYLTMLKIISKNEMDAILHHKTNILSSNDILSHYAQCYYMRNQIAHKDSYLTTKETWEYIDSLLIVYLTIAGRYANDLQEEINSISLNKETDAARYVKDIIRNYEQNNRKAFKYIPLDASNDTKNKNNESLLDIVNSINPLKIIGHAGMGKSTTLEYLTYIDAKSYPRVVPIYIELRNITDTDNGILKEIQNKLSCSIEIAVKLLKNGHIHLYLDGIDEILLNDSERKLIINEINVMIGRYPKTKIVVTDRENTKITIAEGVSTYIIQALTEEKIKDFIAGNCDNKELNDKVYKLLFEKEEGKTLLELVKIPFMLQNLIEIVRIDGKIPTDKAEFAKNFLEAILKRESKEKGTPESMNLDSYLIAIAILDQEQYDRHTLIKVISNTTNELHLSDVYSDKILELLLQLHILEECGYLTYRFVNEDYKEYFYYKSLSMPV